MIAKKIGANLAALAVFFVLASCATKLNNDNATWSAIDAGYPSIEFRACGHTWNGIGICGIENDKDYRSVNFQIQGYGTGNIVVDSKGCGYSWNYSYSKNELITVPISGQATENCLFTFTMTPDWDGSKSTQVYPIRGHLAVQSIHPGDDYDYAVTKQAGDWGYNFKTFIGSPGDTVKVTIAGCGFTYQKEYVLDPKGYLTINLGDAVVNTAPKICAMSGIVNSPKYQDKILGFVVAQYVPNFSVLPLPKTSISGGKLTVTADSNVSVISLGSNYTFSNKATFSFDPNQVQILRTITIKGRSTIQMWIPSSGGFVWVR